MTSLFELAARMQSTNVPEEMLWMLAKVTLVLAIGRLLLAALPRASAATRHAIATAALVAAASVPLLGTVAPAIELNVGKASARSAAAPAEARPALIGVTDDEAFATAISVARATGLAEKPLSLLERTTTLVRSSWKGIIVISVATISVLMLVHMLVGMAGVGLVARRAAEIGREPIAGGREVRLLRSDRVAVPVVWGLFRPVLLLPGDAGEWPAERLRVVLQHELAHLQRWDGVSLVLTRIAVSLFWFHPLAWSLERAGRSECERACDDLVLASGTKPSEYADHLLAIAREMPVFDPFRSVTLAMSRKSQLEGRLLSILQKDVARRVFSGRGVAIACALAVAVIAPVAALRVVAKPSDERNKRPVVKEELRKSESEVEVIGDAIGDFVVTSLGGEPSTGRGWHDRAFDLYHDDKFREAAAAFRRAADEGYRRGTSHYNAACSYALSNDAAGAVQELERALNAGWDDYEALAEDSDFDAIRGDARFRQFVDARLGGVIERHVQDKVEKYHVLRRVHEKDADEWYGAGLDLLRVRKLDESIDAFEQAIARGENVGASMYNIACAYSLKQDAPTGMTWLRKAIENGYSDEKHMLRDSDIALLRDQKGFPELLALAEDLEMRGCCDGPLSLFYANWSEAARHHAKVVQKHPASGRAWFNLGFTSLQAREFPQAIDAFRRAIELGYRTGTSSYNIACAYALQKNSDAAFQWLEKARTAGFDVADRADHDEDLASLHRDARWDGIRR
jgi:beta-lactamase regulating signal transducer with metallopeptidase domain